MVTWCCRKAAFLASPIPIRVIVPTFYIALFSRNITDKVNTIHHLACFLCYGLHASRIYFARLWQRTFCILHPSHFLTQGRSKFACTCDKLQSRRCITFGCDSKPSSRCDTSALSLGIEVHDSGVETRL
jgi:hypothetical protein